jgi:FkbM family methyltransferase
MGATCLSVGANLGVYPLQFAHWAGAGGRVYAFEPNPATAAVLRRHVDLNGFSERIRIVERAVSNLPGEATFHAAGVDGMSRLGASNPGLDGRTAAIAVRVDSLDAFCAAEGVRPDVIMIDIEGFEVAALRGAASLFQGRSPPAVVVEMHPDAWRVAGDDRAGLESLLAEYRVRPIPLSGQADALGEYGHVALEPIIA